MILKVNFFFYFAFQKMVQTCTFCRNHNVVQPKKDHKLICPYGFDEHWEVCSKCMKTRERQISVAREKKLDYKNQSHLGVNATVLDGRRRIARLCRKCKRHGQNVLSNVKHNQECPRKNCSCEACATTDDRRKHVRVDLTQSRLQKRTQVRSPSSPSASSDSGIFSPGSPVLSPDAFTDTEAEQSLELVILDANCLWLANSSFDRIEDTEEIELNASMLIDQLVNESTSFDDFNLFLSDQEMEALSELEKLPYSMQDDLCDGCINES